VELHRGPLDEPPIASEREHDQAHHTCSMTAAALPLHMRRSVRAARTI
jgi:hypothetical protein